MNKKKGKTVLLVDDDVFSSNILVDDLKLRGFEVLTARTFDEAWDGVVSDPIDVALIDIMLPVGEGKYLNPEEILSTRGGFRTGYVLALWIKREYPDVFLIAYTNSVEKDVEDWFRKHGNGFFSKTSLRTGDVVAYICRITGSNTYGPKCFIVHGHDENVKLQLKNYLQNRLKLPEPIILHEQPNLGRTIIEKFEEESMDVELVFVLLTSDDRGRKKNTNREKRRARQNVIFEMGYFLAKFGRKRGRVILLHEGKLELPSDISGLVYIDISNGIEAAGEEIRREVAEFLP
jgi:CheY-like chemotaxis protein